MKLKVILLTTVLTGLLLGRVQATEQIDLREGASPLEQIREIRGALGTEDYSEISADGRKTVLSLLDRMEELLQGRDVAALSEQHKARLFNDQEQVNAILTQAAEDSRMVCRREQVTGSHRKTTVCLTVAERRRIREKSQDQLRTMPRTHVDRGGS